MRLSPLRKRILIILILIIGIATSVVVFLPQILEQVVEDPYFIIIKNNEDLEKLATVPILSIVKATIELAKKEKMKTARDPRHLKREKVVRTLFGYSFQGKPTDNHLAKTIIKNQKKIDHQRDI